MPCMGYRQHEIKMGDTKLVKGGCIMYLCQVERAPERYPAVHCILMGSDTGV